MLAAISPTDVRADVKSHVQGADFERRSWCRARYRYTASTFARCFQGPASHCFYAVTGEMHQDHLSHELQAVVVRVDAIVLQHCQLVVKRLKLDLALSVAELERPLTEQRLEQHNAVERMREHDSARYQTWLPTRS